MGTALAACVSAQTHALHGAHPGKSPCPLPPSSLVWRRNDFFITGCALFYAHKGGARSAGTIAVDPSGQWKMRRRTIQRRNRDRDQKPTSANIMGGPVI
jgi:hypothetical protein